MTKLLVIGNKGMLGSYFCNFLKKKNIKFITSHKKNKRVDFTLKKNVQSFLDRHKPKIIINLAALTDIELCEKKKKLAYRINSEIPKNIMSLLRINKESRLIHLSTDHLYFGRGPHKEQKTRTCNIYAKSKKKGEDNLDLDRCLILRTNFFGKSKAKKKSLSDWVVESLMKKKLINLYKNVYFSPLRLETLSKILLIFIKIPVYGLYNLGSKNGFSKFKFAKFFIEAIKSEFCNYKVVSYSNNKNVKRSLDMRMNSSKIERKIKLKLPTLKNEISKEIKVYLKK